MRFIDTNRYEEIINVVQTTSSATSIDGDKNDIKRGLEKLAIDVESEQLEQEGYIFIMDEDMLMELMTFSDRARYESVCMGYKIITDADMPAERVLLIDTNSITLSGRVLNIERIGVIDFSENDTEQETRR
jgi:hypothetical protein